MIPWYTMLMSPGLLTLINCEESRDIHTTYDA